MKYIIITKSNEKLKLCHEYYWHSARVWKFKKQYYSYNIIADALNTLEMEEELVLYSPIVNQKKWRKT